MKTLIKLTFVVAFFVATFQSVALAQIPDKFLNTKTFYLPVHMSMEKQDDMENLAKQINHEISVLASDGLEVEYFVTSLDGDDWGIDAFQFFYHKKSKAKLRHVVFVAIDPRIQPKNFNHSSATRFINDFGSSFFGKDNFIAGTISLVDWVRYRQEGRFVGFFAILKKPIEHIPLVLRLVPGDDGMVLAKN